MFWISNPMSRVTGSRSWVLVHPVIITKCATKLLRSVRENYTPPPSSLFCRKKFYSTKLQLTLSCTRSNICISILAGIRHSFSNDTFQHSMEIPNRMLKCIIGKTVSFLKIFHRTLCSIKNTILMNTVSSHFHQ